MNYREKIRKAIECPQFGNLNYGEWGVLNLEQRKLIRRLLDEMDRADDTIKSQYFEIEQLKEQIEEMQEEIDDLKNPRNNDYESIRADEIHEMRKMGEI